jgi:hypothetical protein
LARMDDPSGLKLLRDPDAVCFTGPDFEPSHCPTTAGGARLDKYVSR